MTALARRDDLRTTKARLADPATRLWVALRFAHRPLAVADLCSELAVHSPHPRRQLMAKLRQWVSAGHVRRVGERPAMYAMTAAAASMPDPPTEDAMARAPAHWTQARPARQRLWTAARVLRSFDLVSLRMAADVSEARAKDFVRLLTRANYLRADTDHLGTTRYAWRVKPGPLPPVVRRIVQDGLPQLLVIDRNSGHRVTVPVRPHRQDRPLGWSPSAKPAATGGGINHVC